MDLWTIPHTLLGVLVALAVLGSSLSALTGWIVVAAFAVVWEIFEYLTGISRAEAKTNQVTDIAVALVGYGIAIDVFANVSDPAILRIVAAGSAAVFVTVSSVGWYAYRRYATRRNDGDRAE